MITINKQQKMNNSDRSTSNREMKRHETKQSYTPEMHECELCSTPYVRDAEWKTKCYPCATKKSKPTFRNL